MSMVTVEKSHHRPVVPTDDNSSNTFVGITKWGPLRLNMVVCTLHGIQKLHT